MPIPGVPVEQYLASRALACCAITVRSSLDRESRAAYPVRRRAPGAKARPSINHSNASPSRNSSTDASGTTSIHPCVARLTIA